MARVVPLGIVKTPWITHGLWSVRIMLSSEMVPEKGQVIGLAGGTQSNPTSGWQTAL